MSDNRPKDFYHGAKHRSWRWFYWFRLGFVPALAVVGAVGAWGVLSFRTVHGSHHNVVTVIRGESVAHIAKDLQKHHLIRSSLLFQGYVRWTGTAPRIQSGEYLIAQGTSIPSIVQKLQHGHRIAHVVQVTIPEGFTAKQIADRLDHSRVCSKEDFLRAVSRTSLPALGETTPSGSVRYGAEGYLFPDTYRFTQGEDARAVVHEMMDTFVRKLEPYLPAMAHQHVTLQQVVTEASLVEREAKVASERPVIASVIQNRLMHHPAMRLQIDASVEYVIGHADRLTRRDLQTKSPYNTYLHEGLPPGPIANPGLKAMVAVIHPAHTRYLYYVVKNNGSGEHYFAKTFAQQLHNEALSRKNFKKYAD